MKRTGKFLTAVLLSALLAGSLPFAAVTAHALETEETVLLTQEASYSEAAAAEPEVPKTAQENADGPSAAQDRQSTPVYEAEVRSDAPQDPEGPQNGAAEHPEAAQNDPEQDPEAAQNDPEQDPDPAQPQDAPEEKPEPTVMIPTVTVTGTDLAKGTASILITGIDASAKAVEVPTWSTKNQSDLKWYPAKKTADGNYTMTFRIADHGYNWAVYYSDVYVTAQNGKKSYVGGVITDFRLSAGKPSVTVNEEKGTCTVLVPCSGTQAGLSKLLLPVWSRANGQDDLKWLDMKYDGSAQGWKVTFTTSFLKHTGLCYADVYAQKTDGRKKYLTGGTFENPGPSAGSITVVTDNAAGKFKVTVSDVKGLSDGMTVLVPVWSTKNQSDLKWYEAKKSGSSYVVNASIAAHGYNLGRYYVDVYAKGAGYLYLGGTTMQFGVSSDGFTLTDRYAGKSGKEQTVYTGTLSGLAVPGGAKDLQAAVWSEKGGQDDLKWYPMTAQDDGTWTFELKIANHKTAGKYLIHIYTTTKGGKSVFVAAYTDLKISGPAMDAQVSVQNVSADRGTFEVKVVPPTSASGVSAVSVPVWTEKNGQDDLKWYKAAKQDDGTYLAVVNAANHKNRSGKYLIDVYATGGNGVRTYAGGITYNLKLAENVLLISDGLDETVRTLSMRNPSRTPVRFAVWSEGGGQKDLKWIDAANKGNGIWSADVKCNKFLKNGTYIVHVYSGNTCIKTGSFSWNAKSAQQKLNHNQSMYNLAQTLSSDTPYLILVNRGLHRVAVYQGSKGNWEELYYWPCVVGKPSTPTPTGTYKIKGRFDWFGDGHKCWWATQIEGYYYFHSQIYYWDDAPRQILDGTMDAAASMGCVRLEEPNARWIYTTIPRGTTVHIFN